MPFVGLGLHILLALWCAIHVVRTGQQLYWLIILFSFPLLGSVVYFVVIYLPNSRLEHGARRAVSAAVRSLDPTRDVRDARAALEDAPTAQNQMRLAAALLENDEAAESARLYESCLKGPFASDLEIRFGAARAFVGCERFADALGHLEAISASDSSFRAEAVALLTARCLAGTSRAAEARQAFEAAVARFGSYESRAEYAIWAMATGDSGTAERLNAELDKAAARWNRLARELNELLVRRVQAARQLVAGRKA